MGSPPAPAPLLTASRALVIEPWASQALEPLLTASRALGTGPRASQALEPLLTGSPAPALPPTGSRALVYGPRASQVLEPLLTGSPAPALPPTGSLGLGTGPRASQVLGPLLTASRGLVSESLRPIPNSVIEFLVSPEGGCISLPANSSTLHAGVSIETHCKSVTSFLFLRSTIWRHEKVQRAPCYSQSTAESNLRPWTCRARKGSITSSTRTYRARSDTQTIRLRCSTRLCARCRRDVSAPQRKSQQVESFCAHWASRSVIRKVLRPDFLKSIPLFWAPIDSVMQGWCSDRGFKDDNGIPRTLMVVGGKASFKTLAKLYAQADYLSVPYSMR